MFYFLADLVGLDIGLEFDIVGLPAHDNPEVVVLPEHPVDKLG